MLNHPLDRASNRKSTAAGQGVAGVGGKFTHISSGHAQPRRARLQSAQHDAVTRQDQSAQKFARGVNGLYRHRRTDHHHHQRPHWLVFHLLAHAREGANHGDPPVCA